MEVTRRGDWCWSKMIRGWWRERQKRESERDQFPRIEKGGQSEGRGACFSSPVLSGQRLGGEREG